MTVLIVLVLIILIFCTIGIKIAGRRECICYFSKKSGGKTQIHVGDIVKIKGYDFCIFRVDFISHSSWRSTKDFYYIKLINLNYKKSDENTKDFRNELSSLSLEVNENAILDGTITVIQGRENEI